MACGDISRILWFGKHIIIYIIIICSSRHYHAINIVAVKSYIPAYHCIAFIQVGVCIVPAHFIGRIPNTNWICVCRKKNHFQCNRKRKRLLICIFMNARINTTVNQNITISYYASMENGMQRCDTIQWRCPMSMEMRVYFCWHSNFIASLMPITVTA